jgi:nitrogen fixation protein FixH
MIVLAIGSDNLIRWDALADVRSGEYLNDATVTFTLKDPDGNPVNGAEEVSMPYAAGSDGRYEGVLESTVELEHGSYVLETTAVRGELVGFRRMAALARYAGES